MFNRPAGDGALLNVSLGTTRLTNPRVVELVISNPGDRDVTPPMFHEAKPIKFDFDAVAAVLHVATDPANALLPEITTWQEIIRGTGGRHKGGLLIEPAHLRRGQTITVTVLIDGEEKPVHCVQFPLIDVEQSNVRPGSLSRETANALDGASLYIGPFGIRVGR
ncbi:hypothetical protein [Streptomyces sp. SID12488]|uniref:hypothetical protein n=1 Tax=Streptomyces sp. SID12488 TaxID=2706040 RepID=UPI0013DC7D15|nr:hypothetical protein [Streptomyces sp. SID12488]NEA68630.1 hypothetical protein [Streptomyces sp. SID12488]